MPINAYGGATGMTTQQQAGLAGAVRKKKLNPDGTPVVDAVDPAAPVAAPVASVTAPPVAAPTPSITMPEPAQPQEVRLGMAQAERMRAAILDQNLRDQNAARMKYSPERIQAGNDAARLRLEIAAGRDSTRSNPDPLRPDQNAARQQVSDASLAAQATANGYKNAADFFTGRLTGQGPEARAATALSGFGMNPAAGIQQAGIGAAEAQAGYNTRGAEASESQRRASYARELANQAARLDFQKRNTDRQNEDTFGDATMNGVRQAQLSGLARTVSENKAGAATADTAAATAAASNDPVYIQKLKEARLADLNATTAQKQSNSTITAANAANDTDAGLAKAALTKHHIDDGFMSRLTTNVANTRKFFNSSTGDVDAGSIFGGVSENLQQAQNIATDLATLEQAAAENPAAANQVSVYADNLLRSMPTPGKDGMYKSVQGLAGDEIGRYRAQIAQVLNDIRQRATRLKAAH